MTNTSNLSTANKEISVTKPSSHRKAYGLDWAEASWLRWIYVVFWSWVNPILNSGSKGKLTDDDLFDLSTNDECSQLLNKLETVWEKYENKHKHINIWKIIIKTYWKETVKSGLIFLPLLGVRIAQPLLLKRIVIHINDSISPSYVGYLYATELGLTT
ncbi:unnamed protein product [Rotaria sp. Silwood1]|nr:unnamed protein product [Rotaria sp. Silwood1]